MRFSFGPDSDSASTASSSSSTLPPPSGLSPTKKTKKPPANNKNPSIDDEENPSIDDEEKDQDQRKRTRRNADTGGKPQQMKPHVVVDLCYSDDDDETPKMENTTASKGPQKVHPVDDANENNCTASNNNQPFVVDCAFRQARELGYIDGGGPKQKKIKVSDGKIQGLRNASGLTQDLPTPRHLTKQERREKQATARANQKRLARFMQEWVSTSPAKIKRQQTRIVSAQKYKASEWHLDTPDESSQSDESVPDPPPPTNQESKNQPIHPELLCNSSRTSGVPLTPPLSQPTQLDKRSLPDFLTQPSPSDHEEEGSPFGSAAPSCCEESLSYTKIARVVPVDGGGYEIEVCTENLRRVYKKIQQKDPPAYSLGNRARR
jgi:hypothetical protein